MILKEPDSKSAENKYTRAGIRAEKQMSFYLSRAFDDSKEFYVINDLRLEDGGEAAQIDSLIIHPYGFVVVESKSVTQKIKVNKYGEWTRIHNGHEKGMPSPIKQVERQIDFLKKYLNKYGMNLFRDNFLNKLSRPTYDKFKFDMAIAISDDGVIYRDEFESNVIMKADMVPEYIENIKKAYRKKMNSLNLLEGVSIWEFGSDTLERISKFLFRSHKPREYRQPRSAEIVSDQPLKYKKEKKDNIASETGKICSKCGSNDLEILYGFSYYFKCRDCGANTKITLLCKSDKCKPRIKKKGNKFYKFCEICGTNELFHINNK